MYFFPVIDIVVLSQVGLAALAVAKQLKSKEEVRAQLSSSDDKSRSLVQDKNVDLYFPQVEGLGLPRSLWSEVSRLVGGITCENTADASP